MRDALDDEDAAERPELIAPLRRLIHSVIVHAQPGVKGHLEVEIKGRLQELLGLPFVKRSVGGGLVPRHRGFDWLISSHLRMGMSFGGTRTSMLRATPG
jgi:hypothetical protein